jgi:hypothetical protein
MDEFFQTILISNTVLSMREFQKKNCIKNQCVTNCQYLYDIIKKNFTNNAIVKPVLVISYDTEIDTHTCIGGHLVIDLDGDNETIIDPSYDIFSSKNKSYFYKIKDFMDSFNHDDKSKFKKCISDFIHFTKIAQEINNGEFRISDKKFYNDQSDYIENIMK